MWVVKQTCPDHHVAELVFKAYASDRQLCVITVLKCYSQRTLNVHGTTNQRLLTYGKPHHAASRSTIRSWASAVLLESGVDLSVFTPHSTRSAATSRAGAQGPPHNYHDGGQMATRKYL